MMQYRLDANGKQQVNWPANDAEIVRLGEEFIQASERRPAERCFPALNLVKTRCAAAAAAMAQAQTGDADRSGAALTVEQTFEQAQQLVRKIVAGLSYHHLHELPELQKWGLKVVRGPRGQYLVKSPRNKADVMAMLETYLKRENELPEANRLADPALDTVAAALAALTTSMAARQQGRTQREQGVQARTVEAQKLLDLLQVAAAYHCVVEFDGVVDARLQDLSFEVTTVTKRATAPVEPANPA